MSQSTSQVALAVSRKKPRYAKPLGFPLSPHKRGWCKKIKGQVRIVCGHVPPEQALRIFYAKAPRLYGNGGATAGTPASLIVPATTATPTPVAVPAVAVDRSVTLTVANLKDQFLVFKSKQIAAGELRSRTFYDCRDTATRFAKSVGGPVSELSPARFGEYRRALATSLGPHALTRHIQNIRAMFTWAYESELIPSPIRYGVQFEKPSAAVKRKDRARHETERGTLMFSPDEIEAIRAHADPVMDALILLALNGGFGNTDLASLPLTAIDFENAIIDFPRPKNGVGRRVPLWAETVQAIQRAIKARPAPRNPDDRCLAFLSPDGLPLVRERLVYKNGELERTIPVSGLSRWFADLLTKSGVKSKANPRHGLNFYGLRRTFRTIADEVSRDQHAIHRLMGHSIAGMSGVYIQRITDERLKAVTDAVRERILWPIKTTASPPLVRFAWDSGVATARLIGEILDSVPTNPS